MRCVLPSKARKATDLLENLRPCQDFAWSGGWSGFAAPAVRFDKLDFIPDDQLRRKNPGKALNSAAYGDQLCQFIRI